MLSLQILGKKWTEHRDWEAMTKFLHLTNLQLINIWQLLWAANASTNPQLHSLQDEGVKDKPAQHSCRAAHAPCTQLLCLLQGSLWTDMSGEVTYP